MREHVHLFLSLYTHIAACIPATGSTGDWWMGCSHGNQHTSTRRRRWWDAIVHWSTTGHWTHLTATAGGYVTMATSRLVAPSNENYMHMYLTAVILSGVFNVCSSLGGLSENATPLSHTHTGTEHHIQLFVGPGDQHS